MQYHVRASQSLQQTITANASTDHQEMRKKFVFHGDATRCGSHEFLVWQGIPGHAIIHTFDFSDLLALTADVAALKHCLRLEVLSAPGNFKTGVRKTLKAHNVRLTPEITVAIAKLASFMGIRINATTEQIMHFVADVIQGFAIQLQHQAGEQWAALAGVFESALATNADRPIALRDQGIKKAFLDGIRLGNSSNWNTMLSTKHMQAMHRKSKTIGLEDTAKILSDEMDAAKLSLRQDEDNFLRRSKGR